MHHLHHEAPTPLSPRYDITLAVGAILGYGGLTAFLITQLDPALRIDGDVRYAIAIWCICLGGVSSLSWLLRPRVAHVAYALVLGRALAALPDVPDLDETEQPPRAFLAGRRWFWSSCGTIGACAWTLGAAIDITAGTGRLDVAGANLAIATLVLCHVGVLCETVRFVGPSLAAVDDVYELARLRRRRDDDEDGGGTVTPLRRPS